MEIVRLVLSQCFNAIYVDETSISIEAVESDMCCGPFDVVGAKHEDSRRSEGRAQKKKKNCMWIRNYLCTLVFTFATSLKGDDN